MRVADQRISHNTLSPQSKSKNSMKLKLVIFDLWRWKELKKQSSFPDRRYWSSTQEIKTFN